MTIFTIGAARIDPSDRTVAIDGFTRRLSPKALAVLDILGIAHDDPRVNPNGGAIALGHPLGMSGARLAMTATEELVRGGGRYALVAMCIGVGQGIALLLERA